MKRSKGEAYHVEAWVGLLSPIQAFYDILCQTGYVRNKKDLARFLRLNEGNVYAYLYDPAPRLGNEADAVQGRNQARIVARPELIQRWAFAVQSVTRLRIDVLLLSDGGLDLLVCGHNAQGEIVSPSRFKTLHGVFDFSPPCRWEHEWEAYRFSADACLSLTQAVPSDSSTTSPGLQNEK
jgi:hypothetical protein